MTTTTKRTPPTKTILHLRCMRIEYNDCNIGFDSLKSVNLARNNHLYFCMLTCPTSSCPHLWKETVISNISWSIRTEHLCITVTSTISLCALSKMRWNWTTRIMMFSTVMCTRFLLILVRILVFCWWGGWLKKFHFRSIFPHYSEGKWLCGKICCAGRRRYIRSLSRNADSNWRSSGSFWCHRIIEALRLPPPLMIRICYHRFRTSNVASHVGILTQIQPSRPQSLLSALGTAAAVRSRRSLFQYSSIFRFVFCWLWGYCSDSLWCIVMRTSKEYCTKYCWFGSRIIIWIITLGFGDWLRSETLSKHHLFDHWTEFDRTISSSSKSWGKTLRYRFYDAKLQWPKRLLELVRSCRVDRWYLSVPVIHCNHAFGAVLTLRTCVSIVFSSYGQS